VRSTAAFVSALTAFTHAEATVGAGRLATMVITSIPSGMAVLLTCAELAGTKFALNSATVITVTIVLVFMMLAPLFTQLKWNDSSECAGRYIRL
jgi:hypothetical protein